MKFVLYQFWLGIASKMRLSCSSVDWFHSIQTICPTKITQSAQSKHIPTKRMLTMFSCDFVPRRCAFYITLSIRNQKLNYNLSPSDKWENLNILFLHMYIFRTRQKNVQTGFEIKTTKRRKKTIRLSLFCCFEHHIYIRWKVDDMKIRQMYLRWRKYKNKYRKQKKKNK